MELAARILLDVLRQGCITVTTSVPATEPNKHNAPSDGVSGDPISL